MIQIDKELRLEETPATHSCEMMELEASVLEFVAGGSGGPVEKSRLWTL